ncbi:hypothetical protein OG524_35015 [Streptomyces sp. NBC_01520]|uniref:hypothetical protein n=1 Tax=Streptomyces sp. NBC_01520 TaxID=2903892 RepID=UPI00386AA619
MRAGTNRFGVGFGEAYGDYPVAGVAGALAQVARRLIIGLSLALIVALAVDRPSGAFVKGVVATSVVIVMVGLRWAWGRLSARWGLRRCYLYPGGLVLTDIVGRPRAVAWEQVAALNTLSGQSLFMSFHRFEVVRRGYRTVAFLAMGAQPPLVAQLLGRAAENGVR